MTLRWGIVSAGKISHDFVNAFNSFPDKGDQAVVSVAARDKSRAAEFAKLHKIPKVADSYQALAKSSDVDVVYIGALNPDHYALTKLFLENGKHVLCEKPFCLNFKQTESLINLAKKKNLFFMEAVWSRFCPAYIYLENEIAAGNLGDVSFLEGDFGIFCEADRMFKKDQGGSALLDIGIYLLQLSQYVFKKYPERITAVGELNSEGVDETETIILEYGGGKRAVLNTQSRLRLINRATIYGSKGRITLEDPFHFPDRVTAVNGDVKKFPLHTSPIPYNFENSAGLVYQAVEVAKCIRSGQIESPRMSHKQSLELAKLRDTIRKQLGVHYDVDDQEFA
ncbi:trans-1,2-dihydrobenzene-1,2-diol dehydrogenase-like [Helicoverpa zea]|uniref:trans-1,2-dihydrobenzene-1,2-diol dehydrogenase-like n=1 Tax=Helicoverpa zea TaxID=7113 RepID=UPI001F57E55E|nr:trans-1,2-dihydrobenzene-1,2-diol dehydrogenase-like [Helicoverpa zea]XP_047026596.1 trans-1,2-dihydrobenzene-1,2-diol dehydrogenase-like [Helicoverpa zea]